MTISRRRRKEGLTYQPSVLYYTGFGPNPNWVAGTKLPYAARPSQQTDCYDELHPGPPYKAGGPLDIWDFSFSSPIFQEYDLAGYSPIYSFTERRMGRYWVEPLVEGDFPLTGWKTNWNDATNLGPTGWNKFKPVKPGVDLGVALAELRETFSSLVKKAVHFKNLYHGGWTKMQNPAKTLLESNFGWIPLANDIQKAITTFANLDSMIQRIRDMNGRWEHRGGSMGTETESWETSDKGARIIPAFSTSWYTSAGRTSPYIPAARIKWEYESKTWFEGMFKYYIPDVHSAEWERKARRKLMGLTLNASTLWELIPYSWLVDWITNAGDVFSNTDPGLAENLVCAYAYVMRTSTITATMTQEHIFRAPINSGPITRNVHTIVHRWSRKQRVAASPFGFGLSSGSFSPKQIAIMAALGLSR